MNDRDQYDNVCRKEFAEIKTSLDRFYVAIFEGKDGELGLKAQVQIHDRYLNGFIWLGGVIVVALISLGLEVFLKK